MAIMAPCQVCGEPKYLSRSTSTAGVVCHPCRRRMAGQDPDKPMTPGYKGNPRPTSSWQPLVVQCVQCSVTFTQRVPQQKYCSNACRGRKPNGSSTKRGYGAEHRRERRRWEAMVAAGVVDCARVDCLHVAKGLPRWIAPGEPWDLGHDRVTKAWHGPEHRDCNRSEGASFGNKQRKFDGRVQSGVPGRTRW